MSQPGFVGPDMLATGRTMANQTMNATFVIQSPNKTNNGFGNAPVWTNTGTTIGKLHPMSATQVPQELVTQGRKLFYLIVPFNTVINESNRVIGPDGTVFTIQGVNQPRTVSAFTLTVLVSTEAAQGAS